MSPEEHALILRLKWRILELENRPNDLTIERMRNELAVKIQEVSQIREAMRTQEGWMHQRLVKYDKALEAQNFSAVLSEHQRKELLDLLLGDGQSCAHCREVGFHVRLCELAKWLRIVGGESEVQRQVDNAHTSAMPEQIVRANPGMFLKQVYSSNAQHVVNIGTDIPPEELLRGRPPIEYLPHPGLAHNEAYILQSGTSLDLTGLNSVVRGLPPQLPSEGDAASERESGDADDRQDDGK